MATQIIIKHSSGSTLPTLSYGELGLNFKKGTETLYAKNTNNEIFAINEWSKILNKPTTLSGFGISVSDTLFDLKYAPSSHFHDYLPLSGGTITSALIVNAPLYTNEWFRNTVSGQGLFNEVEQAHWYASAGYWNADKDILINGSKVWYAGNDGAGSGLDADLLDGINSNGFSLVSSYPSTSINNYSIQSGIYTTQGNTTDLPSNSVGNSVIHCNWDGNAANQLFLQFDSDYVGFRRKHGNIWQQWKQLAFTDSNVASATKLQTTRTIWGQPFTGEGDVNGNLRLGSNENETLIYNADNSWGCGINLRSSTSTENRWLRIVRITSDGTKKTLIHVTANDYNQGWVGINTESPQYLVDVNGTFRAVGTAYFGSNLKIQDSGSFSELIGGVGKSIKFYTNDGLQNPLNLFSSGNVSIGTGTDSGYKLDVNGGVRLGNSTTNGLIISNGTQSVTLTVDSNGNLKLDNAASGASFYATGEVAAYASGVTNGGAVLTGDYLPLSGGTISNSSTQSPLIVSAPGMGNYSYVQYNNGTTILGYLGMMDVGSPSFKTSTGTAYSIWHAGNLNPANYLNLWGGTFVGGGRIDQNANIFVQQANESNATGLFWENLADTEKIAGIGALTVGDTLTTLYLGWGASPWDSGNNFSVSTTSLTYKNNTVWHAGNFNPANYLPLSGGMLTGYLVVNPTNGGNYNEGIRIGNASNGWSNIQFGVDGTSSSGQVSGQWIVGKNPGFNNSFNISYAGLQNSSGSEGFRVATGNTGLFFNGNTIWHAGNLNPTNYLPLSGGTLTGTFEVSGPVYTDEWFRNKTSGLGLYNQAEQAHWYASAGYWNATKEILINGSKVWYAGNFNPSNYLSLSGGVLTGDLYLGTQSVDKTLSVRNITGPENGQLNLNPWGGLVTANGYKIWHAGNDGAGSSLDADLLDGLHSSDFAKSNYVSYAFNNNGWKRIARISSIQMADQTGTFYINNQYGWSLPSPIILTFGLSYRSVAFLNQLGGISGTVTQARIVYSSNADDFYFEVYHNGGTNNPMRISYVGMSLAELYTTEVIGEIPSGYTSFNLTLGNNQLTGNSDSADKLKTSRTIWGQNFNGEGNITGALSGATTGTFSGSVIVDGPIYTGFHIESTDGGLGMSKRVDNSLGFYSANNIGLTLKKNGNVIIGANETDSGYKLDVNGTGRYSDRLTLNGGLSVIGTNVNSYTTALLIGNTVSRTYYLGAGIPLAYEDGFSLIDYTNNIKLMYVDLNGNFTIGVNSGEGYKLDVKGTLRAVGEIVSNSKFTTTEAANAFGHFGNISCTWGNTGGYPTLFSGADDRWIMHINPHISYIQNGVGGYTGSLTGARVRFAANTAASTYWDLGIGVNSVGADKFSIGRNESSFFRIHNDAHAFFDGVLECTSRIFTGFDSGAQFSVSCSNWFRSSEATGWYNQTYGGGITMEDYTYVKISHNKSFWVNGNIVATGEVTAYAASDIRLKTDIKPLMSSMDVINKLNPVSYKWNNLAKTLNPLKTDGDDYGLIAQELEEVLPNLVHDVYNTYKSVDYVKLVPFLIKGMQEQSLKIERLERRIEELSK